MPLGLRRRKLPLMLFGVFPKCGSEAFQLLPALFLLRSLGIRFVSQSVSQSILFPGAGRHQLPCPRDHGQYQDKEKSPQDYNTQGLAIAQPWQHGKVFAEPVPEELNRQSGEEKSNQEK